VLQNLTTVRHKIGPNLLKKGFGVWSAPLATAKHLDDAKQQCSEWINGDW